MFDARCCRFMESRNLQPWTRIGAMNRLEAGRTRGQRAADVSSAERSPVCRQDAGSTLRFMESFVLQPWTRILRRKPEQLVAPVFQPARRADGKVGVTAERLW